MVPRSGAFGQAPETDLIEASAEHVRENAGDPARLEQQDVAMPTVMSDESTSVKRGAVAEADDEDRARLRCKFEGKRSQRHDMRETSWNPRPRPGHRVRSALLLVPEARLHKGARVLLHRGSWLQCWVWSARDCSQGEVAESVVKFALLFPSSELDLQFKVAFDEVRALNREWLGI